MYGFFCKSNAAPLVKRQIYRNKAALPLSHNKKISTVLGGLIVNFATGESVVIGFNLRSFVVAVLGSVVLLVITGATRRK